MKYLFIILALSLPASAGQIATSHPNLLYHWVFNECSGTTSADSSPNLKHLTINAGAAWVTGMNGCGMVFASNVGAKTAAVATPTNLSYVAWVKNRSTDDMNSPQGWVIQQPVDDAGDPPPYHNTGIFIASDAVAPIKVRINLYINQGSAQKITTSGFIYLKSEWTKTWRMVAGTFDGTFLKLYVDGVEVASNSYPGNATSVTQPFWISQYRTGQTGRQFPGIIDEVAVFNRGLTSGEIKRMYTNGLGRYSNAR
jgi:hypothetical protein